MAKKETAPSHTTIKTEGDNNNIHYHVGDNNNPIPQKEKKPNWIIQLVVGAVVSIAVALIIFYVENRGSHSEPIHNDPPAILPLKK